MNVVDALIAAGLKADAASQDVIVASQGQSVLFYVPSQDERDIARLVAFLQQQPWVDVVFTRGGRQGLGSVPGTFSLDVTQGSHASRSPDVVATLGWTSNKNPYGVPGTQTINSARNGPLTGAASGHGGLSPWVIHNTLVFWGDDFQARARVTAPASLADLMPTVLGVLGVDADQCDRACGRVLQESLRRSPDRGSTPARRTLATKSGAYRAALRISSIAGHDYVDEGARDK